MGNTSAVVHRRTESRPLTEHTDTVFSTVKLGCGHGISFGILKSYGPELVGAQRVRHFDREAGNYDEHLNNAAGARCLPRSRPRKRRSG